MKTGYLPYLFPLIAFLVFRFLVGFDGLYGQDSYEYLRYSAAMHGYFVGGEHPGSYFWAIGFPVLAGLLALTGLPVLIVIQLINLLSLFGIIYFSSEIVRGLNSQNTGSIPIYIFITLASSPYLMQSSLVIMTDALTTLCVTGAFLYGFLYQKKSKTKDIFLFALFACLAVATRYVAVLPLLPIVGVVIVTWFKQLRLMHLLSLLIPIGVIAIHFHFKQGEAGSFLSHQWLLNWSPVHMFQSSFETVDGFQSYKIPNLFYAISPIVHPGFILIGGILIILFINLKKDILRSQSLILICSILLYALFLAGIPFQNKRFLLITFPLIVIVAYPAFLIFWKFVKRRSIFSINYSSIAVLSIVIVNSLLILYVMRVMVGRSSLERDIASQMAPYESNVLYGFDIDVALKGRGCEFDYKNLWVKEYDMFKKGGLVIFNEEATARQWNGKNPMINWNKLKENYELKLLDSFDQGWKLYEIK